MYFQYGNYQHADNSVNLTVAKRANQNSRGFTSHVTWQMTLEGVLIPSSASQSQIKSDIQELESAYAFDGRDAGLYHDDGTVSPHFLQSSRTLGGVRVASFEWLKDQQTGEYATGRSFKIMLEADVPGNVTYQIFTESISVVGTGGPRFVLLETLGGPPQRQKVANRTSVRATQSGRAIGFRQYPPYPRPLWPAVEQVDRRRQDKGSPRNLHGAYIDWPISWSYSFLSHTPLGGIPGRK